MSAAFTPPLLLPSSSAKRLHHFCSPPLEPFYPNSSFPSSSLFICALPGLFALPRRPPGRVWTVGEWAGRDYSSVVNVPFSLAWTPRICPPSSFSGYSPHPPGLAGKLDPHLRILLCCQDCLMSSSLTLVMAACCCTWQLPWHRQSLSHTSWTGLQTLEVG